MNQSLDPLQIFQDLFFIKYQVSEAEGRSETREFTTFLSKPGGNPTEMRTQKCTHFSNAYTFQNFGLMKCFEKKIAPILLEKIATKNNTSGAQNSVDVRKMRTLLRTHLSRVAPWF